MSAPTVACVLLANGRPEMVKRAVKSFRAQTYENKELLILNSGNRGDFDEHESDDVTVLYFPAGAGRSIGALRNSANLWTDDAVGIEANIIAHFDSDDWSHPNRIAEQVALLQSSGAECVGYSEMLFWREPRLVRGAYAMSAEALESGAACEEIGGEAWIWRENPFITGTSMMYWRKTWERAPFPDYSAGCDDLYWAHGDKKKGIAAVKIESVSGSGFHMTGGRIVADDGVVLAVTKPATYEPRMIASIHGGNTCAKIDAKQSAWRRVPEWDSYCREVMCLSGS